jgi:hypothetical protein
MHGVDDRSSFSGNIQSVPKSVQLALARQDVNERESSDDGEAGRMTATARADIGAGLKPDR